MDKKVSDYHIQWVCWEDNWDTQEEKNISKGDNKKPIGLMEMERDCEKSTDGKK